jgi:glutamyl-tRNA reductase
MQQTQTIQKGFPVNLFLDGRNCLVIGAGKTALKKIQLLLDSGATIQVIAPECCPEIEAFAASKKLLYQNRPFQEEDLKQATLVFAATNNRATNRQILKICRAQKIFCSCVDGNWQQSDFTTPATTKLGDLSLSVSYAGTDGRQARLVRNSLERHLRMMKSPQLVVVGTDHRHLPIQEREPFHLAGARLEQAGFMIMQLWGIHEFFILNTCNRIEVIAVVSEETAQNGILRHILGFPRLKKDQFYLKTGNEAFEHLAMVAAGMFSQTPGENHIAAQLKEALDFALQREWAGAIIQEWVSSAFHVSKAIKNSLFPALKQTEIEHLAFQYLEAQHLPLEQSTLMILGAGTVGSALLEEALGKVKKIIYCYHQTPPKKMESPKNTQLEICSFKEMPPRLKEVDILMTATQAPAPILCAEHADYFKSDHPVLAIDLGLPRNIDPMLAEKCNSLTLLNLDDLKTWHRQEEIESPLLQQQARELLGQYQNLYQKLISAFPTENLSEASTPPTDAKTSA